MKLKPIPVSWKIDIISGFSIKAEQEGSIALEFIANFGERKKRMLDIYSREEIEDKQQQGVTGFGKIYTAEDYNNYQYQLMQLSFEHFFMFKMTHTDDYELFASGQAEVVDPFLTDDGDIKVYNQKIKKQWAETGICPDPLFYEILESDFLKINRLSARFSHYILIGKESYVEIIGKNWSEQSLGAQYF